MKTKLFMVMMLVSLITVFTACDLGGGGGNPVVVDSDIPILPVIGFGSEATNVRAIQVSFADDKLGYSMYAPILTGWKGNTVGVKAGKTYTEGFLEKTVEISVTKANDSGTITFTGTLSDNCGTFKLTYDPSDKTFSYEHDVFLKVAESDSSAWLRCEFTDVQLDNKNYFHSNFTTYFMEWEQEDYDNWKNPPEPTMEEPGPWDGVKIGRTTSSEFYFGPSKEDNTIIVSGWAWKNGGMISKAIDLDHAPGLTDIDFLKAFIDEEENFDVSGDDSFLFAFYDGNDFTDFISEDYPADLEALAAILPWTLLP